MAESELGTQKIQKKESDNQVSQYLSGYYWRDIPWWPFLLIGILTAIVIGIAASINLGFPPIIIPVSILGVYIAILVLQKPEVGAYILIISVFTNISDILTDRGLPSINRPLIALTIGSVLINYYLKTGKYNQFPTLTKSEWALISYYTAIIFSVIVLPDKSSTLGVILDITKDFLVGVSIYITLNTQNRWKTGAMTLLVTVTILAAMGVFKTATGSSLTFFDMARNSLFGQLDSNNQLRYGGPIGESNLWGQVLVSTIPFVIYRLKLKQTFRSTIILTISGLLILLAMIYTSSRGAMVALIFIAPLIALDLKVKPANFLIGVLLFFALLNVLPDSYQKRFSELNIFSRQNALAEDEAVTGRTVAMLTGLEMFRSNPIFGVGFGQYSNRYWEYAENLGLESGAVNVNTDSDKNFAHSLYIEVMSETGLAGSITFLLFFVTLLGSLNSIRNQYGKSVLYKDWTMWVTSLTMSILTFLVSGFFLHGVFLRYIWVFIGLAMSAISLSDTPKKALP